MALWVAGVWGCAASPAVSPVAPAPAVTLESREPTTIEEAQAQLEQARAQLPGAPVDRSTPATTATPDSATGGAGATTACGNACGAMVSMHHAVDAICRIAGDADARCTDARRTMKDSETKVAGCGCPPT
jgi:hypothetical protein